MTRIDVHANGAAVRIPMWAVSIIILLITNMVLLGFAAGKITQRVDTIDYRLNRIENHIFDGR